MKPTLRLKSGVGVVYDGNSLMHAIHPYITSTAPVSGSGCTTATVPIAGQTWTAMRTASTDVTSALAAAGDFAVLLLWEHTNQLNSGTDVVGCQQEMLSYVATVRAARPDVRIVVVESLPREGVNATYNTVASFNSKLQQLDQWCFDNRKKYDWEFVSVRVPGSPFRLSGFTTADFDGAAAYWASGEAAGVRTHLNDAGYQIVAKEIRRALYRVRAR